MTVFALDKPMCLADTGQIQSREKVNIQSLFSKVGLMRILMRLGIVEKIYGRCDEV